MGERLTDDIIDAYCDKLQESVNWEVDGMLAMQYILLEPNAIKNLIKGDKNICQIIYDHCRAHYLVLFRNKLNPKRIIVYDPIVPHQDSVRETLNDSVREQILTMFGHLYQDDELVEIAVETGLSTQNDCWSCGLRAVAFITHLLLGINPANYEYDLEEVGKFIMQIIKMDRPNRKVIASGQFGRERKDSKSSLTIVRVTKGGNFSIENGTTCVLSKQPSMESLLNGGNDGKDVNILKKVEEKLSKLGNDNNSDDRSNSDEDNNRRKDGIICSI
uniref:Ubiquitin-like protease family profile domain-containing protein n=1 Tax=Onchocerca volvulus TaxID=6282 RepID=A0A8R1TQW6_ONCVO